MCSCYRPDGAPVPLRTTEYVTTLRLLQRFEPCNAAEAHSIQTIMKVKDVWNLISCVGTKHVSPPNNITSTTPFIATPPINFNFYLFF